MSVLKVGDKLEVMVANVYCITEPIGTILTVTDPDGYDPFSSDRFLTNAPSLGGHNNWFF